MPVSFFSLSLSKARRTSPIRLSLEITPTQVTSRVTWLKDVISTLYAYTPLSLILYSVLFRPLSFLPSLHHSLTILSIILPFYHPSSASHYSSLLLLHTFIFFLLYHRSILSTVLFFLSCYSFHVFSVTTFSSHVFSLFFSLLHCLYSSLNFYVLSLIPPSYFSSLYLSVYLFFFSYSRLFPSLLPYFLITICLIFLLLVFLFFISPYSLPPYPYSYSRFLVIILSLHTHSSTSFPSHVISYPFISTHSNLTPNITSLLP